MRPKKKCNICSVLISGNNFSNHVKLHSVPEIKCTKCDYRAHFPSIIEYHYQRKHVYKVKQGRPLKTQSGNKNKPRIFTKNVLAELKNSASGTSRKSKSNDEQNNDLPSNAINTAESTFAYEPHDENSFALTIDASSLKGSTQTKRKCKPIVDELENISAEKEKIQLTDISGITNALDSALSTKRHMYFMETGALRKSITLTTRNIPARDSSMLRASDKLVQHQKQSQIILQHPEAVVPTKKQQTRRQTSDILEAHKSTLSPRITESMQIGEENGEKEKVGLFNIFFM